MSLERITRTNAESDGANRLGTIARFRNNPDFREKSYSLVRETLSSDHRRIADCVMGYRGEYSPLVQGYADALIVWADGLKK